MVITRQRLYALRISAKERVGQHLGRDAGHVGRQADVGTPETQTYTKSLVVQRFPDTPSCASGTNGEAAFAILS